MELNFFEIAEQVRTNQISLHDDKVKKVSEVIAELASTADGKAEIAQTIGILIDKRFNKFDISPYLFNTRNFALGDAPEFRLKKKGITAYWIAPNSSTPKSRNYQETLTMEFDTLSVRPEILLDELEAGRVQGFAEMINDAQEAMANAIVAKTFTILGQVYTENMVPDMCKVDTTSLAQASVNTAIDTVFRKTGSMPTILGDLNLINAIRDFSTYTDTTKDEIMRTGKIGVYRGANIMGIPDVLSPTTNATVVPTNTLYIVSSKIGYAGTYGNARSGQETSIEDWTWNARIDKSYGACVTEPEGLYVIKVV